MRIKKISCLKFTVLTGIAIFVVINVKSAGETGENEQAPQVRKGFKSDNELLKFSCLSE